MFKKLIPHRWISWQVLQGVCLFAFYVAFGVGLYAAYQGVLTFISPDEGTVNARYLYISALLQAIIICLTAGTLAHVLKTFARVTNVFLTPKK